VSYDPDNLEDPLRHRYLDRKPESKVVIPLATKIAAGLGVPVLSPVQRVLARARVVIGNNTKLD
jgi:hypothetical protein